MIHLAHIVEFIQAMNGEQKKIHGVPKNYDKTMFFTCDDHWNKKGNETALEIFLSLNAK